ncbi:MAG: DNA ligase [Rhodocyclales bacterium GT-UBC]|nr:MAG: DNA ligase [Rhodocyclales bacterium GT-UBC]
MSRLLRALLLGMMLALPAATFGQGAPAILLAEIYRGQVDVTRYLVSEKFDGVRAIWNGETLVFRSGRPIHAPQWFVDALPKRSLDGELWMGRGSFERLSGVVRREVPNDEEWRQVRYMIFELPGAAGGFRARAAEIRALVADAGIPWLVAIDQLPVGSRDELQRRFKQVIAQGGEGLVLHLADAQYVTGRSDVLLKMKSSADGEGVVIAHLPGKGKYSGMLGALRVRLADGRELNLGSGFSEQQRLQPPAIGATVTFRYRDLTRQGLPRFATFVRERGAE